MISQKKIICNFILFLVVSINVLFATSSEEYNRYRTSLLTYAQGSELYSIFGHSAIRIIDDSLNTDYIYNYGTFSFNNSNFYTDFLKGKLLYRLAKSPTEYTLQRNKKVGRRIIENAFLLNVKDAKKLVSILEVNYLPKNRDYNYDFFFDNCATRILQVIDTATGLKLNKDYNSYTPISFRKHTNTYLKTKPWIRFGINTLMGFMSDKKALGYETAFLPDHLRSIFLENSEVIASEDLVLVKGSSKIPEYNMSSIYIIGISCIFILLICFWEYKKKKHFLLLNHIIYWPAIILGTIILFLWSYSELNIYSYNFNLLWANPLYTVLLFKKKANYKLKLIIGACLFLGVVYTILYTHEWIVVFYSVMILSRMYNPFLRLKKLAPNII